MQVREVLRKRKRVRRCEQLRHGGRTMAWFGGHLYFTDTCDASGRPVTKVPGAREIPKSGATQTGLTAAFPPKGTMSPHKGQSQQPRSREYRAERRQPVELYRDPWSTRRW